MGGGYGGQASGGARPSEQGSTGEGTAYPALSSY